LPVQSTWHLSRPRQRPSRFCAGEPKFDLAVLDLKLGGSEDNSLGVASELARMGTPFVFLTGMHVDNVHVRKFPQEPVAEKPYDALALLDAVQRALKDATP